jgi:glycosyltransferase involved in cell wall biosynthesis
VLGIVIPLFKHSVLIGDGLASLFAQVGAEPFVVVVVNDGCPFQDSQRHVQALRAAGPAMVHVLFRPNGGLSAARNTGIDYVLRQFPTVEALYFLDADNCLRPRALQIAFARLQSQPEAGWVYPNIDMFGHRLNFDYAGPYSKLQHAFYNICEAGSLVHRRVFEAGARFDEQMRHGYEDWEFWLTCGELGFSGVHEPQFGFLYRNRAESMLRQSKRKDAAILDYVREKHPALWDRRHLTALEAMEAPRHALIFLDRDEVWLGLDAQGRTTLDRAAFSRRIWANIVSPETEYLPPFLIFTSGAAFEVLSRSGLLLWAIHDRETALDAHNVACLEIEAATGSFVAVRPADSTRQAQLFVISRDLLIRVIMSADTGWIEQLPSPSPEMKVDCRAVALPLDVGLRSLGAGGVFGVLFQLMQWRGSEFRQAAEQAWTWRASSVPRPHDLFRDVRQRLGGKALFPRTSDGRRSIGFVLPIGAFGGVERVAFNIAAVFAAAGWSTHLFMLGTDRLELPPEFRDVFTTLNFIDGPDFGSWDGGVLYQGTALAASAGNERAVGRIVAALGWLDVVVNHHSGDLNGALASLRRQGTRTVVHAHLLDITPWGRPTGHAVLALAYEHAYDLVVCGAQRLMAWMHAAGVPEDKLMLTPNAPGHPLAKARRADVLAQRAIARHDRLRVLYLGRLDPQKGILSLAAVIEATRRLGLRIDWRILGAKTDERFSLPQIVEDIAEPPVTTADALTAIFAWADVMVLLSEFEGVPLTVLEAQRLGVCVIATDVGAVGEVVTSGSNGFLVNGSTTIGDTVELLELLSSAPDLVTRVGLAAAASVRDWTETCQPLVERLSRLVPSTQTAGLRPCAS